MRPRQPMRAAKNSTHTAAMDAGQLRASSHVINAVVNVAILSRGGLWAPFWTSVCTPCLRRGCSDSRCAPQKYSTQAAGMDAWQLRASSRVINAVVNVAIFVSGRVVGSVLDYCMYALPQEGVQR